MDEEAMSHLGFDPDFYNGKDWLSLDKVYSICRRQLITNSNWRIGPGRVHEVGREIFEALAPFDELVGKSYFDLGCGEFNPFGISAVLYINGLTEMTALDLDPVNSQRAAEALYDVLVECATEPAKWHWTKIAREEYLARIGHFNIPALKSGNLETGIVGLPIRHIQADFLDSVTAGLRVDVMSSRAVLEHVREFPMIAKRMFEILRPGGLAFHNIDLVDHRAYTDPTHCHYWSFLAEGDDYNDRQPYGYVNRLRSNEIKDFFVQAGFEVVDYQTHRVPLPEGFRNKLQGKFAHMPEDVLESISVCCVIRKPVNQ